MFEYKGSTYEAIDKYNALLEEPLKKFQNPFHDIINRLSNHIKCQIDLSYEGFEKTLKTLNAEKSIWFEQWTIIYEDKIFGKVTCEVDRHRKIVSFKSNTISFNLSLSNSIEIKTDEFYYFIKTYPDHSSSSVKTKNGTYKNNPMYHHSFVGCLNDELYLDFDYKDATNPYPKSQKEAIERAKQMGIDYALSWKEVLKCVLSYIDTLNLLIKS
jgi:hypothetical protein